MANNDSSTDAEFLADLGEELRTQDNRATSEPVFILQQETRRYGIDPDNLDPDGWTLVNYDGEDRAEGGPDQDTNGIPSGWFNAPMGPGVFNAALPGTHRLLDDDGEVVDEQLLEGYLPPGWEWRPYINEWVTVDGIVGFTEVAIKDHLRQNGHNYGKTMIYAAFMHRCDEMTRLRRLLMARKLTVKP